MAEHLRGIIPATATPFDANGEKQGAVGAPVRWLLAAAGYRLAVGGSTGRPNVSLATSGAACSGSSPTGRGRVPVIAGISVDADALRSAAARRSAISPARPSRRVPPRVARVESIRC